MRERVAVGDLIDNGERTFRERVARAWSVFERCALYVMAFSLPLQALALVPGTSLTVTKVAGALLIAAVVVRRLASGRMPFPRTGLEWGIGLFAGACALSLLGSADRTASWRALVTLVQYALVFYAVADVAAHDDVQKVIPWLIVSGAALSGIGGALAFAGCITGTVDMVFVYSKVRRVCFGLLDANEQAMLFLFALAFVLFARELWSTRNRRILLACALAAICAGMALTMSRTGWLGVGILFVARVLSGRRPFRYAIGAALCIAAAGVAAVVIKPDLADAVKRRALEGVASGDTSIASRVVHYASVVDIAQEGGWLGHGLGTAEAMGRSIVDPLGNPTGTTVHNVPLIIWLETGWVGLVCFGWLWSSVIAVLYVGWRRGRAGRSGRPGRSDGSDQVDGMDGMGEEDTGRRGNEGNEDEGDGARGEREAGRKGVAYGMYGAYAAMVAMYGFVSLFMPFIYRSALPILLGCAVGYCSRANAGKGRRA